jgi:hypothetical protein
MAPSSSLNQKLPWLEKLNIHTIAGQKHFERGDVLR